MEQKLHLAACGVGIMASLVAYSLLQVVHKHCVSRMLLSWCIVGGWSEVSMYCRNES